MKNITSTIDWDKCDGLIPCIVQDSKTFRVLMLAYMDKEAWEQTLDQQVVYFYSRSRQCLWKKGETSGNYLDLVSAKLDCDNDTLLLQVNPRGPVCHTGTDTCWGETNASVQELSDLQRVIKIRKSSDPATSYTASLFHKGINKVAQKVGEEAVEVVIEAKDDNRNLFLNESADLLFHLMVLLEAKNCGIEDVVEVLRKRKG